MSEQILARGGSIQQNTGLQRLLTYQEAADILAVKPQTLRQWVCYKKIVRGMMNLLAHSRQVF